MAREVRIPAPSVVEDMYGGAVSSDIGGIDARTVSLDKVALYPHNPRTDLGDLSEIIEGLQTVGQLQPCAAVTRRVYLKVHPDDKAVIGNAAFVIIMGSRRAAAAREADGVNTVDIVIKDSLAASREALRIAAIRENIDRESFNPIEEAQAVADTVADFKAAGKRKQDVASQLGRSNGWVSQRLSLLKLLPELQTLVRSGEMPLEAARTIAILPGQEQLAAWEVRKSQNFTAVKNGDPVVRQDAPRAVRRRRIFGRNFDGTEDALAASMARVHTEELDQFLDILTNPERLERLVALLAEARKADDPAG